jgi:hypothetical protein
MIADLHMVHGNPDRHTESMPCEYPLLRWTGDRLLVLEERDDGATVTWRETDRIHPDRDGRYAVGKYLWPWQLATTSAASSLPGIAA